MQAKIAKIQCPILIVQGSVDRPDVPINKFNAEVLIPELRAAKKTLEVRTYAGQGHCFFAGSSVPRPSGQPTRAGETPVALEAFRDIDTFCRRYLRTQPKEIDSALITHVPVRTSNAGAFRVNGLLKKVIAYWENLFEQLGIP